jgi:hypothetical protein
MNSLRSTRVLAVVVAAIVSSGACTQSPEQATVEEPDRRLRVMCYQAEGRSAYSLSEAGKGAGEARIELPANGPPRAWFNGELDVDFSLSQTIGLAQGLLRGDTNDVYIHVFDNANQGSQVLSVISQASMASRKANARFDVIYHFASIDSEVPVQ